MSDDNGSWRAYWERIADDQAVFRIEAQDYVRRLGDVFPLTRNLRVFDYGCGFGHTTACLSPLVGSVSMWDASATVRAYARQRLAKHANVEMLDLGDEFIPDESRLFDLIIVHSVLQYMNHGEIQASLKRWRASLKPGGSLIVSDLLQPAGGGVGEIAGYLAFAARNGFFFDALMAGMREFGSYFRARNALPLTAISPAILAELAQGTGLEIRWLGQNLSHRRARRTAVLKPR